MRILRHSLFLLLLAVLSGCEFPVESYNANIIGVRTPDGKLHEISSRGFHDKYIDVQAEYDGESFLKLIIRNLTDAKIEIDWNKVYVTDGGNNSRIVPLTGNYSDSILSRMVDVIFPHNYLARSVTKLNTTSYHPGSYMPATYDRYGRVISYGYTTNPYWSNGYFFSYNDKQAAIKGFSPTFEILLPMAVNGRWLDYYMRVRLTGSIQK